MLRLRFTPIFLVRDASFNTFIVQGHESFLSVIPSLESGATADCKTSWFFLLYLKGIAFTAQDQRYLTLFDPRPCRNESKSFKQLFAVKYLRKSCSSIFFLNTDLCFV